ncbi:MAG TPA: non-reducing end alpha-L-arabinofuranosidase family hydrolase [Lacipirellulaceae bacterium]|nr:non-reducing end alpha-L-arabinofuranosidase family hydrolase [Lacipirellulaceae bacterium]
MRVPWALVVLTILQSRHFAPQADAQPEAIERPNSGDLAPARFQIPVAWEYSRPLISPDNRQADRSRAQKDPSVVYHGGQWHVFMTVKLPGRSVIEYCSFDDWEDADESQRTILNVSTSDYYCAPQVFYFSPHDAWYLIYQMGVAGQDKMWVAYSTNSDISKPDSWTPARAILDGGPNDPRQVGGLDYWIICDDERAYLFYTSLDGRMWRLWTKLNEFPNGFGHCELALAAEFFEASHTYRLKGLNKYLTVIEEDGRRYYKAYIADSLDGEWTPFADTPQKPFAGWNNIRPAEGVAPWTDNISHGELIRDGVDQTLTVDPDNLRFLFQGMRDQDKAGKSYGEFPWRIGILTPAAVNDSGDGK